MDLGLVRKGRAAAAAAAGRRGRAAAQAAARRGVGARPQGPEGGGGREGGRRLPVVRR